MRDQALTAADSNLGLLPPFRDGRSVLDQEILKAARPKVKDCGIELIDIRFKRINYNRDVVEKIYARMASERQQIADRFRSEGAGEAAKIIGRKERDLLMIESEAYRKERRSRARPMPKRPGSTRGLQPEPVRGGLLSVHALDAGLRGSDRRQRRPGSLDGQ